MPATKGLLVNTVYADEEGHLWVGTDNGALKFAIDPENRQEQKLIKRYTTNDGLGSNGVYAIFANDQYIFFGTNNGLTRIDKFGKYKDRSKPPIYIKDIRINGSSLSLQSNYELTYKENELEIDFVALSFKSRGNIKYEYLLKNADEDWQTTFNRNIRFPKLTPGTYTFRLKATDIERVENELETPIQFIIYPPFWNTPWFRILILLFIGGIIYGLYKWRVYNIRKKEAEKSATNKKFAELELQALQSQMNPHFVFNALASIKYYVHDKSSDEAGEYLANFAKLMRLFLESSRNKMIVLEEELKLLKLYIEMEQLRLEYPFESTIKIDKNIDTSMTEIPSLLIQPFVENAINHGLFHKKGKGNLIIDFQQLNEEHILCTIEDDGIGRAKAKELKENSIKSHKSRGMEILMERLEVLKKVENINIGVNIIDLYDEHGIGTGTRVEINIPIIA